MPVAVGTKAKFGLAAGLATLRLVVFRCASENGIAHMATSESRINALRRICALMVGLICFFMLVWCCPCSNTGSPKKLHFESRTSFLLRNAKKCQYFFFNNFLKFCCRWRRRVLEGRKQISRWCKPPVIARYKMPAPAGAQD